MSIFSREDGGLVDTRYRGHHLHVAGDSTVFVRPIGTLPFPPLARDEYAAADGTRVLTQYRGRRVHAAGDGSIFVGPSPMNTRSPERG